MPKPILRSVIIRILQENGFLFISQKGSHAKFRKADNPVLTVIVPMHSKEIPYGTLRSILRQSHLDEEVFRSK